MVRYVAYCIMSICFLIMPLETFCKAGKMNSNRYFCCDCELLLRRRALTGEMRQHGEKRAVGRDFEMKRCCQLSPGVSLNGLPEFLSIVIQTFSMWILYCLCLVPLDLIIVDNWGEYFGTNGDVAKLSELFSTLSSVLQYHAVIVEAFREMRCLTVSDSVLSSRELLLLLLHKWSLVSRELQLRQDLQVLAQKDRKKELLSPQVPTHFPGLYHLTPRSCSQKMCQRIFFSVMFLVFQLIFKFRIKNPQLGFPPQAGFFSSVLASLRGNVHHQS